LGSLTKGDGHLDLPGSPCFSLFAKSVVLFRDRQPNFFDVNRAGSKQIIDLLRKGSITSQTDAAQDSLSIEGVVNRIKGQKIN
jgi:hypothetical protein